MSIIAGFFILLAIAILLRFIGNKLIPIAMPTRRLRTIALGWVGGFLGSLVDSFRWQFGPEVVGINQWQLLSVAPFLSSFLALPPLLKYCWERYNLESFYQLLSFVLYLIKASVAQG